MGRPIPPPNQDAARRQRKGGRVNCHGVTCTLGEVVNISASGMRVIAKGAIEPGTEGLITIQALDGPLVIPGRVVWSKKKNWGKSEAGVQFVGLTDQHRARLLQFADYASRDTVIDELSDTSRSL